MADNVNITPGTGDVVAADEIGGVKYQRVKVNIGADGAAADAGHAANPFRVDPTGATSQPVSAASLPLPTGAATEATLATLNGKVTAVNTGAVVLAAGAAAIGSVTLSQYTPVSGRMPVDPSGVTQPVSAAALPLPTGAAAEHTAANSPHSVRLTDGTSFYKGTTPADTQPVSAASLPLPTGAATEATLATLNGKVTAVNTGAVVLAAGTALAGKVLVSQVVGQVYDTAGNALTVKRARATITGTTAADIVAAVTSKQIQVLGYSLQTQGGNTPSFYFLDDAGSPVTLSRTWKLDATGAAGVNGVQCVPSPLGCGVDPTTVSKKLQGKVDATGSVVVEVTYVEI